MQFWALVADSFRESLDRKIFWVLLLITGVVILAMGSIAFDGDRVTFLFGLWDAASGDFDPVSAIGRARLLSAVVFFLLMTVLGWVGIILMVIASAGFFPTLMQPGTIDILVSKPISRPRLFLYKYLGSMVFVIMQATVFVVLTFLVMGLRWGLWAPGYLLCIPLIVLLFSYVYCVTVLVAVKTRSSVAAILLSLGAWFLFACPPAALDLFESFPELRENKRLHRTLEIIAWVPPKTADIPYIAARWCKAGASVDIFPDDVMGPAGTPQREQINRAREIEVKAMSESPWLSIGSSLVFETVIVLWAMLIFCRRDY